MSAKKRNSTRVRKTRSTKARGIQNTWDNASGQEIITCGDRAHTTSRYYLYIQRERGRMYLSSYTKRTWGEGNFTTHYVPDEGRTWKREAAMVFSTEFDAKKLRTFLGLTEFKIERHIEVNEH